MLRASEPKVLGNQLVLDLWDEGGSRYEILPKLLFRHDELLLDFIYPVVHQVKLYPEQVRRVGGECIRLKIVVDGGTSGEHRSRERGLLELGQMLCQLRDVRDDGLDHPRQGLYLVSKFKEGPAETTGRAGLNAEGDSLGH
ncbi:hypothetical protein GW17_00051237 [Ensete ventricosum]|nr:hypothetical protein GW17_00051237 [Ensete ventricosum]